MGGPAKGKNGRGVREGTHNTLIGGAVETVLSTTKNGAMQKKAGRLRLQVLRAASEDEIGTFIRANVAPGSTLKRAEWTGDSATALAGYHHQREIQGSPQRRQELAPQIHQALSNLKAWRIGIQRWCRKFGQVDK